MFQVSLYTEVVIDIMIKSYNGKTYINHPDTVSDHHLTTLGNINNQVLAVGGVSQNNNQVEIFDIVSNTWTTKTRFPFDHRSVGNET